jgi:hypothetical protein
MIDFPDDIRCRLGRHCDAQNTAPSPLQPERPSVVDRLAGRVAVIRIVLRESLVVGAHDGVVPLGQRRRRAATREVVRLEAPAGVDLYLRDIRGSSE